MKKNALIGESFTSEARRFEKLIFFTFKKNICDGIQSFLRCTKFSSDTFPEQLTSVKVKEYKPIPLCSKIREKNNKNILLVIVSNLSKQESSNQIKS